MCLNAYVVFVVLNMVLCCFVYFIYSFFIVMFCILFVVFIHFVCGLHVVFLSQCL